MYAKMGCLWVYYLMRKVNGVVTFMRWVYWSKLYDSKFQASCLAKRMEEDWWIYGYECPDHVEVFRSRRGRFGVRFTV